MNFVVKLDAIIIFYSTYCATIAIPQVCNQRSLTRVLVLYANINGQKVCWAHSVVLEDTELCFRHDREAVRRESLKAATRTNMAVLKQGVQRYSETLALHVVPWPWWKHCKCHAADINHHR